MWRERGPALKRVRLAVSPSGFALQPRRGQNRSDPCATGAMDPISGEPAIAERPQKTDPIRPTDDEAIALARKLLRSARFGALGVLEPGSGAPFVSRVSLATEMDGSPVMLISALSTHTKALFADPRCSLLVGEPGKGDPLAHPRLTLVGTAHPFAADDPALSHARRRYLMRHPKARLYADFSDFAFVRMSVTRASLNGGFGKAYELQASDFLLERASLDGFSEMEEGAIAHMHEDHPDAVKLYATRLAGAGTGEWQLSSLDPQGLDFVDGDRVARLAFDPPLAGPQDLRPRLVALAKQARDGE
jgi:putative heme iron utilization protein